MKRKATNNPVPPDTIAGEARAEWGRIAAELEHLNRLNAVDRAIMVIHCHAWALNRQAYQHVMANGISTTYTNGNTGPTAEYKAWGETTKTLRGTLADLGLTPKARDFDAGESDEPEALTF